MNDFYRARVMENFCLERIRDRKILKYRIQRVCLRLIQVTTILSAAYLGWASRSLIASSLSMVRHYVMTH
jgi:hypothetical protein